MSQLVKVVVGVPSNGHWCDETACAVATMVTYSAMRSVQVAIVNRTGPSICSNRHAIVQEALKLDASHVLFVDADMTFSPTLLLRLLEHNRMIVACDAMRRNGSGVPVVRTLRDEDRRDGLTLVRSMGTGIMLVHTYVFKSLDLPHWLEEWDEETQSYRGEDTYFCMKAVANGYGLFCDFNTSKSVGHIGQKTYYLEEKDGKA